MNHTPFQLVLWRWFNVFGEHIGFPSALHSMFVPGAMMTPPFDALSNATDSPRCNGMSESRCCDWVVTRDITRQNPRKTMNRAHR
jgi:hypothetical protein